MIPPRPERKEYDLSWLGGGKEAIANAEGEQDGFNFACDQWEEWLPREEEIAILCYTSLQGSTREDWKDESDEIHKEFRGYGKAIAKRLGTDDSK